MIENREMKQIAEYEKGDKNAFNYCLGLSLVVENWKLKHIFMLLANMTKQ